MIVLAVLDTMYNWRNTGDFLQAAPRAFVINPKNYSGKRLYRIVGTNNKLLVTNCCKMVGIGSRSHGVPDPEWLKENIINIPWDILLVCGNVAKRTYEQTGLLFEPIYMMHPAARTWTNEMIEEMRQKIANFSVPVPSTGNGF